MARHDAPRRLIVNADDFGGSDSINRAVIRAHKEGILTTASLMVNGAAAREAVALARQHPGLGVGLHLTLVRGSSCLRADALGELVDERMRFSDRPVLAGLRYFFRRDLRVALEREIAAQLEQYQATGLALDHVNGHLHFHLHPVVFRVLMHGARRWGIRGVRLTREPLGLGLRLRAGRYGYRLSHAAVFGVLAGWAGRRLREAGIAHPDRLFGLLEDGRIDRGYLVSLIPRLPGGDSELYSHPSLDESRHEFEALVDPEVRTLVERERVELIRYQDL